MITSLVNKKWVSKLALVTIQLEVSRQARVHAGGKLRVVYAQHNEHVHFRVRAAFQ